MKKKLNGNLRNGVFQEGEWLCIYKNGEPHREDGPAFEHTNGDKYWYLNGKQHREDGPAIENTNGNKYWYLNGELHREDGPAIELAESYLGYTVKKWSINGKWHREDGPDFEHTNGDKEWYLNGKQHRLDGPALEHANGDKEWWCNGEKYTKAEANFQLQKKLLNEKLNMKLEDKPRVKRLKI